MSITPRDQRSTSDVSRLLRTVVEGGYCVGCGACAAVYASTLQVTLDRSGRYCAERRTQPSGDADCASLAGVCPFSDASANEDEIGTALFEDAKHHAALGRFRQAYAGHVAEGTYRAAGSSGGLGTWIVAQMLEMGLVDAVAHVRPVDPSTNGGRLFVFAVSRTVDDLRRGAKSRYYPVEMSGVLNEIRATPGRYAIVGVPCFLKAVRLLARHDALFQERVQYCVGLVCGHLKSTRFAGLFAWQNGIHPDAIQEIDFRHKTAGAPANDYAVRIRGRRGDAVVEVVRPSREHLGSVWGHGMLKYQACDYCDDVFAETADLTIGDAWLPGYVHDGLGTNVVIARNRELLDLVEEGRRTGALKLDVLSPDLAAASQAGGLRHRRGGLAYRLARRKARGEWVPPKRVAPGSDGLSWRYRWIYALRERLVTRSHSAFEDALAQGDFSVFRKRMGRLTWCYDQLYRDYHVRSVLMRVRRLLRRAA
jgi:coenzyme F420 hydrogenase subunit beta